MNKLQVTKFKLTEKTMPVLKFNFVEIEAYLNDSMADYANTVVTEETLKGAKKTRAELNNMSKEFDKERKAIKKKYSEPIKNFSDKMNELKDTVDETSSKIDKQIKFFEDIKKEENKKIAMSLIDAVSHEIELRSKYREQVVLKDEYMNLSTNPTAVRKDIVLQYEALKMQQDAEQQKIDTIKIIVDTYNEQLEFKFGAKEFDYLLEESITEISRVVKEKVVGRVEQEKATKKRLEEEKQQAIKDAEDKIKREAEAEALKVKNAADKKLKDELFKAEISKQTAVENVETDRKIELDIINTQIDKIIPVEVEEDEPTVTFSFEVKGTEGQMEALRNYLNQYGYGWSELF